jgi:hypothetical protein
VLQEVQSASDELLASSISNNSSSLRETTTTTTTSAAAADDAGAGGASSSCRSRSRSSSSFALHGEEGVSNPSETLQNVTPQEQQQQQDLVPLGSSPAAAGVAAGSLSTTQGEEPQLLDAGEDEEDDPFSDHRWRQVVVAGVGPRGQQVVERLRQHLQSVQSHSTGESGRGVGAAKAALQTVQFKFAPGMLLIR